MKYKFIAIEREYGSGGTRIARCLAEECGIHCYGQEILEAVSTKLHMTASEIQKYEESVTNSFLYTIYAISQLQAGNSNILSKEGQLFVAEQEFIRKSALQGSAIYLGHCAAEALKDFEVLKVYIRCSDSGMKARRIAEDYNIPANEIESTRNRFDAKRAKYYYANTAKRWDDFRNYDIILDSAALGVDGCVAALKGLMK